MKYQYKIKQTKYQTHIYTIHMLPMWHKFISWKNAWHNWKDLSFLLTYLSLCVCVCLQRNGSTTRSHWMRSTKVLCCSWNVPCWSLRHRLQVLCSYSTWMAFPSNKCGSSHLPSPRGSLIYYKYVTLVNLSNHITMQVYVLLIIWNLHTLFLLWNVLNNHLSIWHHIVFIILEVINLIYIPKIFQVLFKYIT